MEPRDSMCPFFPYCYEDLSTAGNRLKLCSGYCGKISTLDNFKMLLLLLSRFHDTGRKPSRSVNDQPLPSMETYPYRHSSALILAYSSLLNADLSSVEGKGVIRELFSLYYYRNRPWPLQPHTKVFYK